MEKSNEIALAIDVKNLSKSYSIHLALDQISFSVKKGSVHGFLGPNGAGKSTTMKILSGLLKESSGEFKVFGKIGFLPEHPPLYLNMLVKDYLKFVLEIYSEQANFDQVNQVMEKTGITHVAHRLIGNLSKGYQQRVGIAQALVHHPEIVILDEPMVGLDPLALADIRQLILELKKDHTILFSTHQLRDVELLCSEITLINQGKIVVSGSISTILENLKTKMVIEAKVAHFDEAYKKLLIDRFSLDAMEYVKSNDDFNLLLNMRSHDSGHIKKEVAHFLADKKIGLLAFQEVKLDLEELFKQMRVEK